MIWEFFHQREDSGQEVARIYKELNNVNYHRRTDWSGIYSFFIENMLRLEENLLIVRDILREEVN